MTAIPEAMIWCELADLFFLDFEPDENQYLRVAEILISEHWNRDKTYKIIIELIAPTAGKNMGIGYSMVFPSWEFFDEEWLIPRIERRIAWRQRAAKWVVCLHDKFYRWWVKPYELDKLLNLLPQ